MQNFDLIQSFKFIYQNNVYFQNSKYNSNLTFHLITRNSNLVIQNFDFELIIGYFELSKSQFKAFNLPQDIFQDKRYQFHSYILVIKVKKLSRYYCETHIIKCLTYHHDYMVSYRRP